MNAPLVLEFDGVDVTYGGAPALQGARLNVRAGESLALVGPSGAGKSTLLGVAALAIAPTRGGVRHFGADHWAGGRHALETTRRRIGRIYQDFRLIEHLSVFDNIALPLRAAGRRFADYAGDVEELVRWIGLSDRRGQPARTLSGGEKQRVAIARAVVGRPDIILADEPTGSVDPDMGGRLIRLLIELNRLGSTLIVATHDDRVVRRMATRVCRLDKGVLSETGS